MGSKTGRTTPEKLAVFLHDNLCQNEEHEEHGCGFDESDVDLGFLGLANKLLSEFNEIQIRRFIEIIRMPLEELAKSQEGS